MVIGLLAERRVERFGCEEKRRPFAKHLGGARDILPLKGTRDMCRVAMMDLVGDKWTFMYL